MDTGSQLTSSLVTALVTASLALIGKILFDSHARFRERRSLAGSLEGELRAYFELLDPKKAAENYRKIAASERTGRIIILKGMQQMPSGHPVFDKIADKLGLLPDGLPYATSRIYNVVTGVRLMIGNLSSACFLAASETFQVESLKTVANIIDRESPTGERLLADLKAVAKQGFWNYLWGLEPASLDIEQQPHMPWWARTRS